ncbi:MAG: LacI family transcriptional regulator [Spirochaetaceae bacterium]|jgi:DNA-binding LacI/PurR family transcriptional regulator|nr:LacI family transcriptional regulator [Spirochaetaceae bacterium]
MESEITIYDIAREAGVSPATVSRVLTGKAKVTPGKRDVVEELIRKYHFKPNTIARQLSGSTRILGLMTADIRNPYYAALAVECEKAANQRGYTVLLCNMFNDQALEEAHLEKLYAQRVEAIIQIGCRVDDLVTDPKYAEQVKRVAKSIPFICSGKLDGAGVYSVRIDHVFAMKIVMEYLISLGHRDIAIIGGARRVQSTHEKLQQYIYLTGLYGLSFREEYIREGNYAESGGYVCMKALLDGEKIPSAVIAINDYSAIGAMRAVFDRGLSIPGDLSIVSFDNTFISEAVNPKLTSVDYNYPEFGTKLVETALDLIQKKSVSQLQLIPPRLLIRDSCAV